MDVSSKGSLMRGYGRLEGKGRKNGKVECGREDMRKERRKRKK